MLRQQAVGVQGRVSVRVVASRSLTRADRRVERSEETADSQ